MGCGRSSAQNENSIKSKEKANQLKDSKEANVEISVEVNEIQKESFQLAEEINQAASGNGDKFQIRSLRQRLQKLDLHKIYAPYNIILNLMQAMGNLFINRGTQVNFLAELKNIARLCRILVINFLKNKNFLTVEHQQQYLKIIQEMKNVLDKTQKESFDFGFQLEIQVIQKVVKLAQDNEAAYNKIIKKACDLYNI